MRVEGHRRRVSKGGEGPIPKWKLKSEQEECREGEAGLSSVGSLQSGRLIPEKRLNEGRKGLSK